MKYDGIDEAVRAFRASENAVLLDVRTPEEFAQGHIPGSVNHPLERIQTFEGDPSERLFVYCRSGARSERACAILRMMDYDAVNIGGMMNYTGEQES